MLKKYGRFFADWRDHTGKRHRKSFDTRKQAQKHQDRMQAEALAKKASTPARPSGRSLRPTARRRSGPKATKQRRASSAA
jgi:hypothetical protein